MHRLQVGRAPDELPGAAPGLLEQHRQGAPDTAFGKSALLALDERIPPWDRRLDVVVLTHPHEDHVAGLARILERYAVGRVYEPGMRGPGPGWAAWDAILHDGPARGVLATGARMRIGEVTLTGIWPDPGSVPLEPADSRPSPTDSTVDVTAMISEFLRRLT